MALDGKKVLLIDGDAQGNATDFYLKGDLNIFTDESSTTIRQEITCLHHILDKESDLSLIHIYPRSLRVRNLLYTAITRAKENLIIVGEKEVMNQCILCDADNRITLLKEKIEYEYKKKCIIPVSYTHLNVSGKF